MDPPTARFLSEDPFEGLGEEPVTLVRYGYAGQSPVDLTDPKGEMLTGALAIGLSTIGGRGAEVIAMLFGGIGDKRIIVTLKDQVVRAYAGSNQIFAFDAVTGDATHPTTVGKWKVEWKDKNHFSQQYQVPMHYALFFHKGEAIHESHAIELIRFFKRMSNSFGSHGCVRLSHDDAVKLFDWTPVNTPVEVKQ